MDKEILITLTAIAFGILVAQWAAWRVKLPGILFLMVIGLIAVLVIVLGVSYFFNPLGEGESPSNSVENIDVQKSIAVLPFKDMSADQDQEYLGDGVAEAIIDRLTRVNDLKVIDRMIETNGYKR